MENIDDIRAERDSLRRDLDAMTAERDAARSEAARARETALFTATGEVSDANGSVDLDLDEPHEMVLVNGLAKWPTAAFGQRVRLTIEAISAPSPTEQGGNKS